MKKFSPLSWKLVLPWVVLLAVAVAYLNMSTRADALTERPLPYSGLLKEAHAGHLAKVVIQGEYARTEATDHKTYKTHLPANDTVLVPALVAANVLVDSQPEAEPSLLVTLLLSWGPMLLLVGVGLFMLRQNGMGKGGGMAAFGKSRARLMSDKAAKTLFSDVAGCDEAKEEVVELVEFLKDPRKFEGVGGKIPRGVLLSGPPGTGKTLLARAIAGEANVPFFSISGSDFVEMFVGVGAARVRDLFAEAKRHAPCIIFVDEIDAVGRQRGTGTGGGNDEREQTLNQMLVEMDGFEPGLGVIVLAATNRPDILDAALLRPGRFDRQVTVALPDVRGREQILNVHLRKVPAGPDINPAVIARGTPGFSGAELANLVNEAALLTARANRKIIGMGEIERAKDKILMGPERKSMRMSESERSDTAYHEAGHAVVAKVLKHTDPVHKVSIVPRGRALGVTVQLPEQERYSLGKQRVLDTIAMLFGGRVAEELFTGDITTGASNDYERATTLARDMVTRWGMSDAVGPVVVASPEGSGGPRLAGYSPDTLERIDGEIRRILEEQYARVRSLLSAHAPVMHAMRQALLEWETLDADQVNDLMRGVAPRPPKEFKLPVFSAPTPVASGTAPLAGVALHPASP